MKKRFTAILMAALCMSAPLTAMAGDIDADSNAALTISTDKFTYTKNTIISYQEGFFLESEIADPDLMVVGESWGEDGVFYGVFVTPINYVASGVGMIETPYLEKHFGDQQFKVGDLIKVDLMCVAAGGVYPAYLTDDEDPNSTMTFLGNGVDVFGEEFARVIRQQLVIDQESFNERKNDMWHIDLIKGDVTVDDKVNILDSIQINKAMLAGAPLCDYAKLAGDVNENGEIDMDDSLMILKESIGLTENFE